MLGFASRGSHSHPGGRGSKGGQFAGPNTLGRLMPAGASGVVQREMQRSRLDQTLIESHVSGCTGAGAGAGGDLVCSTVCAVQRKESSMETPSVWYERCIGSSRARGVVWARSDGGRGPNAFGPGPTCPSPALPEHTGRRAPKHRTSPTSSASSENRRNPRQAVMSRPLGRARLHRIPLPDQT